MMRIAGILSNVTPISRRGFLKRSAAVTVAVPAFASLLAACGGDDDDEAETPAAPAPTNTQATLPTPAPQGGASPTAAAASPTAAAASPTAAEATATTAAEPTPTTAAAGVPKKGGTIVVQGHQEISSLHPDEAGPYVHYVIVRNIHEPLIDIDLNYEYEPVLASSYEAAPDGLKYTFTLQEGVKWQDGEDFTAADVKYNYDWYKDPANAAVAGTDFAALGEVETPDDYTVVVNMATIDAAFLTNVATTMLVPEHVHSVTGKDNYSTQPVGTGPFKLKEWKAAEQTTLERWDGYWQEPAWVDEFREEIVPEGSVRAIALENNESDSAVWPLQSADNLRFIKELSDRFDVNRAPGTAVNHFPLNNEHPFLKERDARVAMMYALDRDALINDLEMGLATKAHTNLTPAVTFYYNDDVTKYEMDPAKANELLDAAGWVMGSDGIREKDGVKAAFTITVITGDQRRRPYAEIAQQNWKAVGIDVQIAEQPVATILEKLPGEGVQMDASLFNWTYGWVEPDARSTLRSDGARNFSHYKNPAMDELLDAGVATIDPDERQRIYREVQKLVTEDVPFIYNMFWEDIQIWNKRVKGRPEHANNPSAVYANIRKYWIDEES